MYANEIRELNQVWHMLIGEMQVQLEGEEFQPLGQLSTTEISVLRVLDTAPDVILKDICQQLNMPKSTLTSAVNRLVGKGYIERITASNDKRAFSLKITEKGSFVQKKHLEFEYSVLSRLLAGLSQDEVTTLLHILKKTIGGNDNE